MPNDIEIIPPQRMQVARPAVVEADVPTLYRGGRVQSMLDASRWGAQSRALDSLARVNTSETNLRAQQTALVEQDVRFREALLRHQELPEKWGHELAVRRVQRAEELNELRHKAQTTALRQSTETAHAEAALEDAAQALRAQREFGYSSYDLAWKKKSCDLLGLELSETERRAMLRGIIGEPSEPASAASGDPGQLDDALYEARAELQASGLDTARIDAIIERRKRR